jgi:UDP:flavonoid glycosyltransferase YjiC (YdhE family)
MTAAPGSSGTGVATFLAYVEPVPGRLYPLVETLQELIRRGHRVVVRTGRAEADLLRSIGIDAEVLAPELAEFEPTDWQARTRFGALLRALDEFGQRARPQVADLEKAIATHQPDVVILDETSWGAAAAAEHSGLPWAFSVPSPVPVGSRDAPPFGLGLRPRHDTLGRLRDRMARPLTVGTLARVIARHVNPCAWSSACSRSTGSTSSISPRHSC